MPSSRLSGVSVALFRGSERQRTGIGLLIAAVVLRISPVFCMLYLAIVLTGGGDFVYRYFSAAEAAAACLVGACFAAAFPQSDAATCCDAHRRAGTRLLDIQRVAALQSRSSGPGAGQNDAAFALEVAPFPHLQANPALVAVEDMYPGVIAEHR